MKQQPLTGYFLIAIAAAVLVLFSLQDYGSHLPEPPAQQEPVIRMDDPKLGGDASAPVVIVGFGNYTCAHCAALSDLLRSAAERFGSKVTVTWRDYVPAGADQLALDAAIAARCAAAQGKYWEAHRLLFSAPDAITEHVLGTLSTTIDISADQYAACRASEEAHVRVLAEYDEAQSLSITKAPAFFLNGKPYYGIPDAAMFLDWIAKQFP